MRCPNDCPIPKVVQSLRFSVDQTSDFVAGIQFEELIVYETIPSESLAQELEEYLQTQGVRRSDGHTETRRII